MPALRFMLSLLALGLSLLAARDLRSPAASAESSGLGLLAYAVALLAAASAVAALERLFRELPVRAAAAPR